MALIEGHSAASPQTSAGLRSPSTSPSTSVSPSAAGALQSAGAALVGLSDQLLSEGEIHQDIAANVRNTVDGVLAQGGAGNSPQLLDDLATRSTRGTTYILPTPPSVSIGALDTLSLEPSPPPWVDLEFTRPVGDELLNQLERFQDVISQLNDVARSD